MSENFFAFLVFSPGILDFTCLTRPHWGRQRYKASCSNNLSKNFNRRRKFSAGKIQRSFGILTSESHYAAKERNEKTKE